MEENCFESQVLHTAFEKEDCYGSLSMPVYHTAAYEFNSAEEMEAAFCGRTTDHTYSRITNPTVHYFEKRIRELTGALGVTALNSGMAAISNTIISIARSGDNIVTSPHLFGNTYSLFKSTLHDLGVETRFVDLTNPDAVKESIDHRTCALFLEIITNPQLEVADLKQLSAIAREAGVPLIADTTIIPVHIFKGQQFGIDIEIVSSTKYISGGATSLGGLILDHGTFDWSRSAKLAEMSKQFGKNTFTAKLRKEVHRNLGAYMTPQVAYMQTLGLETLALRYQRQASNCLKLAELLQSCPDICSVNYTGLKDNPYYELSKEQFGAFPGAMFTFDLASKEACFRFMNRLRLIRRATNLFDNKTLAIHPASTIYGPFTPEQRAAMNVSDRTIRLSVGIEAYKDLYNDILQALG